MMNFHNFLVGLNLGNLDKTIIPYSEMLFNTLGGEKIIFVHVTRKFTIPPMVFEYYPETTLPDNNELLEKMRAELAELGGEQFAQFANLDVLEGEPLNIFLEQIKQHKIDLLVVGRKRNDKETRQLPLKLTRKSPCSVFVVPEDSAPKLTKILVPIDFSECSAKALSTAIDIAKASRIKEIIALNVYNVPTGYHYTGKSYEEFAEIMKKNAMSEYQHFLHDIDTKGILIHMHYRLHKSPAMAIKHFATEYDVDLIVTGARGRTASAAMILGSVTEQLISTTEIPLFAVKDHEKAMSLLKALFDF
jgi:nucleotide-binding universal stress UspA family protein